MIFRPKWPSKYDHFLTFKMSYLSEYLELSELLNTETYDHLSYKKLLLQIYHSFYSLIPPKLIPLVKYLSINGNSKSLGNKVINIIVALILLMSI